MCCKYVWTVLLLRLCGRMWTCMHFWNSVTTHAKRVNAKRIWTKRNHFNNVTCSATVEAQVVMQWWTHNFASRLMLLTILHHQHLFCSICRSLISLLSFLCQSPLLCLYLCHDVPKKCQVWPRFWCPLSAPRTEHHDALVVIRAEGLTTFTLRGSFLPFVCGLSAFGSTRCKL